MSQLIIPYLLRQDILQAILGTGNPLDEADVTIGLIKQGLSPSTRTTRAQVLAAEPSNVEFPGYAGVTPIVWSAPYRDGSDNVFEDAGEFSFIVTGADCPAPLDIIGAYWATATRVVIELFDAAVRVQREGDIVRYVPQFGYGQ